MSCSQRGAGGCRGAVTEVQVLSVATVVVVVVVASAVIVVGEV